MKTLKQLHAEYNGVNGSIGYNQYTKEDALTIVKSHMSKVFLAKLKSHASNTGSQFNMYTYTTKEDGSQEIIQDFNGKYYGLNHEMSGEGFWGF